MVSRLTRAGDVDWLRAQLDTGRRPAALTGPGDDADDARSTEDPASIDDSASIDDLGAELLAAAVRCSLAGVDPSAALRHSLREVERRHAQADRG